MRLYEKPPEEHLTELVYWVNEIGGSWPINQDDVPLDGDKPFVLDENGMPVVAKDKKSPERVRCWIKMINSTESDAITSAVMKNRTRQLPTNRRNRRRGAALVVESDLDFGLSSMMRMKAGLVRWEGILTDEGKEAKINDTYLGRLPTWLRDDILNRITDLSSLDEEELGE